MNEATLPRVIRTPLGFPVLPDVKRMYARASSDMETKSSKRSPEITIFLGLMTLKFENSVFFRSVDDIIQSNLSNNLQIPLMRMKRMKRNIRLAFHP